MENDMIRLANSEYLNLLFFVPFFILLFILMRSWRRRKIQKLGDKHIVYRLFESVSNFKPWLKFVLICFAFIFLIIGIVNPQIGSKLEEVKREGVDIMIALDVSNSMKAEDLKPHRLERAKQSIFRLIDKLQNDRLGIIVFAGRAYVQLPLTTDFGAAKLFLTTIDTEMVPTQGTALGSAIQLATQSMESKDNKYKVLIIITDGEDHEETALEQTKIATEQGIIIHTIGMGSSEGGPIPVYNSNGGMKGFLKDNSGNVVITKLNAAILQEIASKGGGKFIRASNGNDALSEILSDISKMEKKNFGTKVFTDYVDRFQYFIALAILFLLLDFFIDERKSKWWLKLNLFGTSPKND